MIYRTRLLRRLPILLWTAALALCSVGAQAAEDRVTVVFVDRMINVGDVPVTDVAVSLACAPDMPMQEIHDLLLLPEGAVAETDRWGQRIARWELPGLGPGEQFVARTVTDATLRPWVVDLNWQPGESSPEVPADVAELYLAEGAKYPLESEAIRKALSEIPHNGQPTIDTVGAIFDYVVDHIDYSRDGTWDAADEVLERGTGSCSEYTFAFSALCRACGIPARFAGGNARRAGAPLHIDRVSHRWAEAYIPGIGWAPFDPTRSDGEKRYHRHFGSSPGNVLVLARGDGGPESALDWRYESFHRWNGDDGQIRVHRRGWWFADVPDDVRCQVYALAGTIPGITDAEGRRGLIRKARSIGHPFSLPWIEDLLYDPAVRLEAAEAVLDIGGPPALPAITDCLARTNDAAGDAEIGQLLDTWTGQQLGADRRAWDQWLNSKAFGGFSAPGAGGS